MGTTGTVTLIANGKTVRWYSSHDSYPEWLGQQLVDHVRELLERYKLDEIKTMINAIKVVSDNYPPTEAELLEFERLTSPARVKFNSWYTYLYDNQSDLIATLKCGYVSDHDEPGEFNYILDFDTNYMQVITEFTSHVFGLNAIPSDWVKQWPSAWGRF